MSVVYVRVQAIILLIVDTAGHENNNNNLDSEEQLLGARQMDVVVDCPRLVVCLAVAALCLDLEWRTMSSRCALVIVAVVGGSYPPIHSYTRRCTVMIAH